MFSLKSRVPGVVVRVGFAVGVCVHACVYANGVGAAELRTDVEDQTAVAVTIYNENLALVKDLRRVSLEPGQSTLSFRGVSANLRAETALLRNLDTHHGLTIREQNFDFDLLSPEKMLEKFVGREIGLARYNSVTGTESVVKGTLLSTVNGTVVRIGDRIEINPRGRYVFDQLPENLRDQPTLSIDFEQQATGTQDLELSYLTGGLGWKADYVAELSADEQQLDLVGWVTLTNNSGASYRNATLQLVAGDVNQVPDAMQPMVMRERMAKAEMQGGSAMQEESLFEYHLYTLNRPTTVADRQTKQVSLLATNGVGTKKELLLQGNDYYYSSSYGDIGKKLKPGVFVTFANTEENKLGMPLPKGIVRVYKRDSKGRAQFVGEDRIEHTAKKQQVRLKLGNAFDVTAHKVQSEFNVVRKNVWESSYRIDISNAKEQAVEVIVREPIPADWSMRDESHPHTKVAAGTAEWRITVPAGATESLTYTTRVRF